MKKFFYILFLTVFFHFSGVSQSVNPFRSSNDKTVKFYPNPATSFINFEFVKDYDPSYSLQVYNFLGKKITELKPGERKLTLPLTDFYRGVYIFQLKDKSGNIVESGKFQVSK